MSAYLDKIEARYVSVLRGGPKGKPTETTMTLAELRALFIKDKTKKKTKKKGAKA